MLFVDARRYAQGALIVSFVLALAGPALCEQWPVVMTTSRSFKVDLDGGLTSVSLPINSTDGSILYRLSCRGGSEEILDPLGEQEKVNWVGPLMCVLNPAELGLSGQSLLAEDESPPWHTRGRFDTGQLVGACGAYPEFGRARSFRLRGFVLSLSVRNLESNSSGAVRRFTLAVSVRRDQTAIGAQAERPNYLAPRWGDCHVVRKGKEPRYCRNWVGPTAGSWALCPEQ
jgi:hypothetical protein